MYCHWKQLFFSPWKSQTPPATSLSLKPRCGEAWVPIATAQMAFTEYRRLDEDSLIEYIKGTPSLSSKIGNKFDDLTIKEVGDGNLNFVYIVIGTSGSFVIKQVPRFIFSIGLIYLYLQIVSLLRKLLDEMFLDTVFNCNSMDDGRTALNLL